MNDDYGIFYNITGDSDSSMTHKSSASLNPSSQKSVSLGILTNQDFRSFGDCNGIQSVELIGTNSDNNIWGGGITADEENQLPHFEIKASQNNTEADRGCGGIETGFFMSVNSPEESDIVSDPELRESDPPRVILPPGPMNYSLNHSQKHTVLLSD